MEGAAPIKTQWAYEISTEKILQCSEEGPISPAKADKFSEKLFEQLNTKKISGFSSPCLPDGNCQGKENFPV